MTNATATIWQNLVGAEFEHGGRGPKYDCLGIVLEVQRRVGYDVRDPVEAYRDGKAGHDFQNAWCGSWKQTTEPKTFDAVLIRLGKSYHVGVIVDTDRILHAHHSMGVIVERADRFPKGSILSFWTPTIDRIPNELAPRDMPGFTGGGGAISFLGLGIAGGLGAFGAGALALAGNLIIGGVLAYLSRLIAAPKKTKFTNDPDRPSFDLGGPRNTVSPGNVIPVCYGEHLIGGQIIQIFQRTDSQYRSRLYMLISLSEGPVYSIGGMTTDQTNASASAFGSNILINGNPISGYPTARVSTRLGTLTQDPIPGFEETIVSGSVNAGLRRTVAGSNNATTIAENVDTVTYTTSAEIDAFEINVNFPAGLYKLDSAGNSQPYSWLGTLRYRIKGNSASEVAEFVELGASTIKANHTRTLRRQNLTRNIYEISLTRSSLEDTNTTNRFSVATWTTTNEINSSLTISYAGEALLAIEALATDQLSGGIPQVASITKGRLCWLTDGVTFTTQAWSDNPAYIALDVITNKRFGLGNYISVNEIDLASFKTWADYCATTITTDGTTHARWQFDHYFDSPQKAYDVLQQIASCGRASIVYVGAKFRVVIDQATTYSQIFSAGNIIAGSLQEGIPDTSKRANVVELQYLNRSTNWTQDVAQKSVTSTTPIKDSLRIIGITRPQQAYRAVQYALNVAQNVSRTIQLSAPVDAVAVEPGDVFRVPEFIPSISKHGRVHSAAVDLDHIRLDQPVTFTGTSVILVRYLVDGAQTLTALTPTNGTYAAGDDIPITPSFTSSGSPIAGDVYMSGLSTTYYRDYRCTRWRCGPDFVCTIEGIEYVSSTFTDDPGTIEEFTDQWPSSLVFPDNVTNLSAREITGTRKDGTVDHFVDVAFTPTKAAAYDVWFRVADLESSDTDPLPVSWEYAGETRGSQYRFGLGAQYKRTIEVCVTPRGPGGAMADPHNGTHVFCPILGRCGEPGVPTNLVATLVDSKVFLTWTAPTDTDVKEYEIRASADASRWIFAQPIDTVRQTFAIVDPSYFGTAKYYLVKAISRSGIPSFTAASVSVTPSSGGQVVILDKSITGSAWTSGTTVSNASLVSSNLRTDANVSTASWTSANTTFPILSQQATIRAHLDAIAYDLTTLIIEAGYRGDSTYARRLRGNGELIDIPWPEQPITYGTDLALLATSPLAKSMLMSGEPYPWASNFKILVEYDLASDTAASVWDGWKTYTKPFEAKARYYVRWRITMTIANAEFTIDLVGLYVNVSAVGGTLTNRDDQTHLDDHFQSASVETGEVGMAGWNISGTGSSVAMIDAETTHWGVASIATSATIGNFGGITTTRNFFPNATSYIDFTTWVKLVDTANCNYQIGFMQNTGTKTPTRGIYVKTTGGGSNWSLVTTDATSSATTNSGLATSSAQWWMIRIQVYGVSSVVFTVTSDSGSTATATHTTFIPAADALLLAHQVGNDANAVKTLYVDRSRLIITGNKAV